MPDYPPDRKGGLPSYGDSSSSAAAAGSESEPLLADIEVEEEAAAAAATVKSSGPPKKKAGKDGFPDDDAEFPNAGGPSNYHDHDDDDAPVDDSLPPSYENIDNPSFSYPAEPPSFSHYNPTTHRITNGKTISHDAHLHESPEALYQFLLSQAALPPSPLVKIEGTHTTLREVTRNGKTETERSTVTDFNITLSLSYVIVAPQAGVLSKVLPDEKRHRGTRMKRKAKSDALEDALTLRDWCARYIASPGPCKEFRLRKRVDGIDEQWMRGHLEAAVRATNYQGHLKITFPVTDRSVVLAPANWITRIRYGPWRWFFYLTFLWLITWPLLWAVTRHWDVADAVWAGDDARAKEWTRLYAKTIGQLARGRREGEVRYVELESLRLAMLDRAADERRRPRGAEGVGAWMGAFLDGLQHGGEAWMGGWGGDEDYWGRGVVYRGGRNCPSNGRRRGGNWWAGINGWTVSSG